MPVSRLPAMAVAIIDLATSLPRVQASVPAGVPVAPALLLVCYLLWAKADLVLFRGS